MTSTNIPPIKQRPQDDTASLIDMIGDDPCRGDISMQSELFELMNDSYDHYKDDVPEEEPTQTNQGVHLDWDTIALYTPTDQDVPLFQAAQNRRKDAAQRLEDAYRIAVEDFKRFTDDMLECVENLYRTNDEKLNAVEMDIQHLFVANAQTRLAMEQQLEDTMKASAAEIQRVLMKVSANKHH